MKPELMWTKQHEGFLFFESALKPRYGQGAGFRVKLPGVRPQVIRATPNSHPPRPTSTTKPVTTTSVLGSDYDDKLYIVRLPKPEDKEKVVVSDFTRESVPAIEAPLEDVFTVRPHLVPRNPIPITQPAATPGQSRPSSNQPEPSLPEAVQQQVIAIEAPTSDSAGYEEVPAVEQSDDPQPRSSTSESRPPLPVLETAFTPPVSMSPQYGSPYSYMPPLPYGVALDQHGIPYEVTTGRPVYLQPPPPMYNPRPMVPSHMAPHAIPFVPGHMHHNSTVSPDFVAQPPSHTPPVNGFIDPSTGAPLFSLPRQSARIEIRSPTGELGVKSPIAKSPHRPSGLRTSAVAFEPSRSSDNASQGYFPSVSTGVDSSPLPAYDGGVSSIEEGQAVQQPMDPAMMGYAQYPPYYYPEAYGYPAYMDMSQVGQYEMYPSEPQSHQGAVYY